MLTLFALRIEPMPAPRPRARAIRTASGKSFVSMYNPADYMKWKERAAALLHTAPLGVPYSTPVSLEAIFHCTQPKTTKLFAPKPDIDNYLKSLLDAITDAGWWTDDTLVHKVIATKCWAPKGTEGFIHIFIKELE